MKMHFQSSQTKARWSPDTLHYSSHQHCATSGKIFCVCTPAAESGPTHIEVRAEASSIVAWRFQGCRSWF